MGINRDSYNNWDRNIKSKIIYRRYWYNRI